MIPDFLQNPRSVPNPGSRPAGSESAQPLDTASTTNDFTRSLRDQQSPRLSERPAGQVAESSDDSARQASADVPSPQPASDSNSLLPARQADQSATATKSVSSDSPQSENVATRQPADESETRPAEDADARTLDIHSEIDAVTLADGFSTQAGATTATDDGLQLDVDGTEAARESDAAAGDDAHDSLTSSVDVLLSQQNVDSSQPLVLASLVSIAVAESALLRRQQAESGQGGAADSPTQSLPAFPQAGGESSATQPVVQGGVAVEGHSSDLPTVENPVLSSLVAAKTGTQQGRRAAALTQQLVPGTESSSEPSARSEATPQTLTVDLPAGRPQPVSDSEGVPVATGAGANGSRTSQAASAERAAATTADSVESLIESPVDAASEGDASESPALSPAVQAEPASSGKRSVQLGSQSETFRPDLVQPDSLVSAGEGNGASSTAASDDRLIHAASGVDKVVSPASDVNESGDAITQQRDADAQPHAREQKTVAGQNAVLPVPSNAKGNESSRGDAVQAASDRRPATVTVPSARNETERSRDVSGTQSPDGLSQAVGTPQTADAGFQQQGLSDAVSALDFSDAAKATSGTEAVSPAATGRVAAAEIPVAAREAGGERSVSVSGPDAAMSGGAGPQEGATVLPFGNSTEQQAVGGSDRFLSPNIQRALTAIHSAASGENRLRVQLSPAELGSLMVEIVQTPQGIVARLEVGNAAAQKLLLDSLADLQQALTRNQSPVDRIDVVLTESRTETSRQQREQNQQRGQNEQQRGDTDSGQRRQRDDRHPDQQDDEGEGTGIRSDVA